VHSIFTSAFDISSIGLTLLSSWSPAKQTADTVLVST
jgi:hypothetical protein